MNNSDKLLLLGDQAIALGAIHAGISGVYAYPGTPSTEITEYIQDSPLAKARGLHSSWCTNEKTAMEAALGVSYVGKRALVCMKHVGMNVCADAFVNSAITGVNGGIVVLAADDPSMHSSQNEQDSRFYGKFAMVPILEPSSQQEAYDMMEYAYDLSEKEKLPVLMRITTRMAHSRAAVKVKEKFLDVTCTGKESVPTDWVLLPGNARRRYLEVIAEQPQLLALSQQSRSQRRDAGERDRGVRNRIQLCDGELSGRVSVSPCQDFTISFADRPAYPSCRLVRRSAGGGGRPAFRGRTAERTASFPICGERTFEW